MAGRFLGIDYGTKRIGVAVSDERGTLAFPKIILQNDAEIFRKLGEIIEKENIGEVVAGESVNFSGRPNPISKEIEIFISKLKRFNLPVKTQKEFLTTVEARRYNQNGQVDASAAALILQRYLDKINLV